MCLKQEEGEVGDKHVSECSCDVILVNSVLHVTITPTLAEKQQFKEMVKGFHLDSCLSVDWNSQECKPRKNYFEYV